MNKEARRTIDNMSAQRKIEKNQEVIRKLSLSEKNKICMDCTVKSTPYVVLDFGTFVCTFCAGVHRQHQFNSKGISMTNFKDNEVEMLKNMGNEKAEQVWRPYWDPKKFPKPSVNEEEKIKKFIYDTYVKKIYQKGSNGAAARESPVQEDIPEPQPIQKIINNPSKIEVTRARATSKGGNSYESTSTKAANAPAKKESNLFEEDFFGTSTTATATNPNNGEFEVDFNDSAFDSQQTTKPAQPKINGRALADELFKDFSVPQPVYGRPGPNIASQTGGGLDDFFSGPPSMPAHGVNNPMGVAYGNQPVQYGAYGNQPLGAYPQQPGFNGPPRNMGSGWNQQPPNMNAGWNQQPPNMYAGWNQQPPNLNAGWNQQPNMGGAWNQTGFGAPQQMNRASPQLNPAFQEPPKQQTANDPFASLGSGFGLGGGSTAPLKPNPSPMNQQPSTFNKVPSTNTNAFEDNPFDF